MSVASNPYRQPRCRCTGDDMRRGFVTIAVGQERYYRMARTLLRSYRQNCDDPMPFALIADRENEYTAEFDDVVILDDPTCSWMDKLRLLDCCPYDENLFIDADCLIYRDINFLWQLYRDADDFSCFGKALPLEDPSGWFTSQASAFYPIQFCTHLHGMLYFIRKSDTLDRMQRLCSDIIANYQSIVFKGFNDQLADEPVYALAMAVLGLRPVDRKPEYYCFVPFATKFRSNYARRTVCFSNPTDGAVRECCVVHWGNRNTLKARYRLDAGAVNRDRKKDLWYRLAYRWGLLLLGYQAGDFVAELAGKISWFWGRAMRKIRKNTAEK